MTNVVWTLRRAVHTLQGMWIGGRYERYERGRRTLAARALVLRFASWVGGLRESHTAERRAVHEYRMAWRVMRRMQREHGEHVASNDKGGERVHVHHA